MRTFRFILLAAFFVASFILFLPAATGFVSQADSAAAPVNTDTMANGEHVVSFAPPAQSGVGPTSTPDAEGVIYAVVQEGDSFWSIAARHGLTLEEIYELNDASEGDFVQVGQRLIVGYGDAASSEVQEATEEDEEAEGTPAAESEATPTPAPPTPTPTSAPRGGEICLSAFVDENRNGQRDSGEELKGSVAFTISTGEAVVSNYVSDGLSEPYCIIGLDNGDYRVTRSMSTDEVLTTPGEVAVSLADGMSESVAFGSYIDAEAATTATDENPDESSEVLSSAEESAVTPEENGEGGITRVILIAAVVVAVLLLVGVLVVVLSVRRSTV